MLSHNIAVIAEILQDMTQKRPLSAKQVRDLAYALRRCSDDAAALEECVVPTAARISEGGLPPGVVSLDARRRLSAPVMEPMGGGDAA